MINTVKLSTHHDNEQGSGLLEKAYMAYRRRRGGECRAGGRLRCFCTYLLYCGAWIFALEFCIDFFAHIWILGHGSKLVNAETNFHPSTAQLAVWKMRKDCDLSTSQLSGWIPVGIFHSRCRFVCMRCALAMKLILVFFSWWESGSELHIFLCTSAFLILSM